MKNILFILLIITFTLFSCNSENEDTSDLKPVKDTLIVEEPVYQCNYLNEETPDSIPKIFAKGVISTGVDESSFEINKFGNEMIFSRVGKIMILTESNNTWSDLEIASFSGKHIDGECCFSPEGNKIYFASRRYLIGANSALNTWVSEKKEDRWDTVYAMKKPFTNQTTHAVSVANSGNIYCSGIDLYEKTDSTYIYRNQLKSELKGSHPYIAPDESYILFCAAKRGRRDPDLFISFNEKENWTEPIHLNDYINTTSIESNPFVSPDGNYLFFIRKFDVYWVKFDLLKLKALIEE